jgi:hypothetical protein
VLINTVVSRLIPQAKKKVNTEIQEKAIWLSKIDPSGLLDLFSKVWALEL